MLREIARRSPVQRIDLLHDARSHGLSRDTENGRVMFKVALKRLRAYGCIIFDDKTIHWTGRALPVRYVSDDKERAWLQAKRDAALAALRPPGAPIIDPAEFAAWQPPKRFVVSDGMRAALRQLISARLARSSGASKALERKITL